MRRISDRKKIEAKLKNDKRLDTYTTEELDYLKTPLGKAYYKQEPEDNIDPQEMDEPTETVDEPTETADDSAEEQTEQTEDFDSSKEPRETEEELLDTEEPTEDFANAKEREAESDAKDYVIIKKKNQYDPRWKERLTCKICGKQYSRSAKTSHYKTQYHKIYDEVNKKFLAYMIGK